MNAYAAMMPRLGAEERLGAVRGAALAAGQYEKHAAGEILAELERQAAGDPEPDDKPGGAAPGTLAGMGVGAVIEPTSAAGAAPVEGFEFRARARDV